jgi:hypothetical protein
MPRSEAFASAIRQYQDATMDIAAKIQQDRSLHMRELANLYMEACSSDEVSDDYLSMLEATIADRSTFSARKTMLEAGDIDEHAEKLAGALNRNQNILQGGAVSSHGISGRNGLKYSTTRSAAVLENMHKKLMHDRSVHFQELENIYTEGLRGGEHPGYVSMVKDMLDARQEFNTRKTMLDAANWVELEEDMTGRLGERTARQLEGGARAGADTISVRCSNEEGDAHSETFADHEAANMWKQVMEARDFHCAPHTHS